MEEKDKNIDAPEQQTPQHSETETPGGGYSFSEGGR